MAEGGARVLVVDDNKVNRLVLGRTLEREGHAVSVATNGREALALLRAEPFELLLLDMEMPELDGFAVLEILKNDPELSELPVIVTSSLEGVENVARCIELGAEDFLHKPVHPVLLKARVGSSLAKKRARERQRQQFRQELAHQVAERSRALGEAFAQGSGGVPTASSFGARYTRVRTLGEGGMGVVFEVERKTDGARLAAKVMTGELSRQAAARFAREAEIGARVQHPNLVSIVDLGVTATGAPFLVMELVTGGSLEGQRPRFGELAWAVSILRQVAQGLAALHAAGVVHRDLKPANVLLTAAGTAKVSDFGIARMSLRGMIDSAGPTAAGGLGAGALTGTGMWLGTPLYMAPESAEGGRTLTTAADVYAFGLLGHELITGALPHSTPPILLALARQPIPIPPRLVLPGLPSNAADALAACLAPGPSDRPRIEAVLAAL